MTLRLTDLEPELWRVVEPGARAHDVASMDDAQGLYFNCPKCGNHGVLVWFRDRGVPADEVPGPARWSVSGAGLNDLTLSPSILLTSGCGWHGFVVNGEVTSV